MCIHAPLCGKGLTAEMHCTFDLFPVLLQPSSLCMHRRGITQTANLSSGPHHCYLRSHQVHHTPSSHGYRQHCHRQSCRMGTLCETVLGQAR